MRDSVFTPILDRLATFSSENEKFVEKFQRDPTLLPEQDVLADQEAIEEKYTAALFGVIDQSRKAVAREVDRVFTGAMSATAREDALNAITWGLSPAISTVLTGLWVETWNLASIHATRELDILDGILDGSFTKPRTDLAEFAVGDRDRYFLAYPPDYGFPLAPSVLRDAVDSRTMKLANDIDAKTADRIRETVRYFVENRTAPDGSMSIQARKDLVGQLGLAFGAGVKRKPLEGDYKLRSLDQIRSGAGSPQIPVERRIGVMLPDDIKKLQEDSNAGLKKRLRTIARTELGAAYNTARLNVYKNSGKVQYVRWNAVSDERLCEYCASRVGTVHPIDKLLAMGAILPDGRSTPGKSYDVLEYMLPLHPNDRCHWVPVETDKPPDPDRKPEARAASLASKTVMALGGVAKDQIKQGLGSAAIGATMGVAKRIHISLAAAAQAKAEERQRQEQSRKVFLRGAAAVGATAIGLAVLYRAIGTTEASEAQAQAIKPIDRTPVPLWAALPSAIVKSVPELVVEDVDIREVNTRLLKEKGLQDQQIKLVLDRVKEVQADEVTSISRKLPPQLLSSEMLRRFPKLRDATDLRNLTVSDLVRKFGVESQLEATKVLDFVRRDLQNRIPEIPDIRIRNTPITKDTTWQELYQYLPVALRNKRGEATAKAIKKFIRDSYAAGKPIRSLEELRSVKGVGKKTLDYMKAQDFTQNPNQLGLGFYSDDAAAEILASQLGVGPKLSKEIIQEIRDGGQFSDVSNLIDRIELRRRRQDGQMASLNFGERQKKALRDALDGKVFPVPSISIGQARASLQKQRVTLGSSSKYDLPPLSPGATLSNDRIKELASLVDQADRDRRSKPAAAKSKTKSAYLPSVGPSMKLPRAGRITPKPIGDPSLASYDERIRAARKAIDTYKGQKVYLQGQNTSKPETYKEALARIDRELLDKQRRFESTRQHLGAYAARLNDETEGILRAASEAEDVLKKGTDADFEALINSLDVGEPELAPTLDTKELGDEANSVINESRSLLDSYSKISPTTAIDTSLAQSVKRFGDQDLDAAADKLLAGMGLDEEALDAKVASLQSLVSRVGSAGGSGVLQDIAIARDRAVKARKVAAEVRERLRTKLAERSRLQVDATTPTTRAMKTVMNEVVNARNRWSNVDKELSWYRSAQRSPDADSTKPVGDRLVALDRNIDRAKRAERDADVALIKIRSYKGDPGDVQYVTQEMVNQARDARSLITEMARYREYLQTVQRMSGELPAIAKKAEAFQLAFDRETQAITNGLKRISKERELLTEIRPSGVKQVKALMEADLQARDNLAFWKSRGFTKINDAAIALNRSLAQWESDHDQAAKLIGASTEIPSDGMSAIARVRKMLTETQSHLVQTYQPQVIEGQRLANQNVESVQAQLLRLGAGAPSDSERYGMARRELLNLEQKDTLTADEQRRAAELDRQVRDHGMSVYDRLLPESKQKAIAEYKASLDTDLRRLARAEEELQSGVFRKDQAHQAALRDDIEYLKKSIAQWRGLINQARSVNPEDEEALFRSHGQLTASFSRRDRQQSPHLQRRGFRRTSLGVGIRSGRNPYNSR